MCVVCAFTNVYNIPQFCVSVHWLNTPYVFLICCNCILKYALQSEAALMQGIVPEKNQRRIFDQLIQGGLDVVVKEGEVCLIGWHSCKNNVCHTEHSRIMQFVP